MNDRRYDFHGLGLAIATDLPEVAETLDRRFRQFAVESTPTVDLRLTIRSVTCDGAHPVRRPDGSSRPLLEQAAGEAAYFADDDLLFVDYADRVRILSDPRRGSTQVSVRWPAPSNVALVSGLLTVPLIESLKRLGLFSVHAALLAVDGRGLLLPGTRGAGKSTLTLLLTAAGFDFLGDDMLFLRRGIGALEALAFPDEIDVTDETARLLPELGHLLDRAKRPGAPKHQVSAVETYGARFVAGCEPAAVVFPRVSGEAQSTLSPLARPEALLELAPNILLTEPGASQAHLAVLAELVERCPCFRLETGRDFDRLPGLLRELLA